ncbi:unnamed protein product [Arctia plantaginis]|uniref:PiggyBac transposable element-derived protein domain-containing protein n=1 Tax=Arctia plantaginis TaxID=874455 RepID=A0A8S0ZJN3_ARCPL|nr:unnamed protein product [Arctia plantaginis]
MYLNVFMYSAETESASEPTPGPSGEQQRVNVQSSLAIEIKKNKSGKAADNKNIKKMSAAQRKELAHRKDIKQVGNYRMPELPTSKGKGKARVLQPWEKVQSVHAKETTNDDVIQGTPSPLSLEGPCLAAAEESDDGIIEGAPPKCHQEDSFFELTQRCLKRVKEDINLTTPQTKRSCIRFSPSTGIVQVMEVSFPPVVADIELINCTPTTSTRTEAFDSGRSARSNLSIEIDVQIERDLEVNSGSEIDEEENVVDRLIGCTTGEDAQEPCPTELNELLQLDSTEDQAIRNMAAGDMDVLSFNWCADYKNFEGVQEEFSGPSGPTFDHSGMSPLQVFQQIWDTNIIDHIVNETNRYARQLFLKQKCNWTRLSRWKDVTSDEFRRFLSILMLQSVIVNNVEREYWYPRSAFLQTGDFRKIMPYNRFLLIKRCLHFNNNSSLPEYPSKLQNY